MLPSLCKHELGVELRWTVIWTRGKEQKFSWSRPWKRSRKCQRHSWCLHPMWLWTEANRLSRAYAFPDNCFSWATEAVVNSSQTQWAWFPFFVNLPESDVHFSTVWPTHRPFSLVYLLQTKARLTSLLKIPGRVAMLFCSFLWIGGRHAFILSDLLWLTFELLK